MTQDLSTISMGRKFLNPFLLASAPPTELEENIRRAFKAGWGGVVTKTIGLHPVVNVAGPKTIFMRSANNSPYISIKKRPDTVLHSSWNWELISTKPLKEWLPSLKRIKQEFPEQMLIASIMAGSGSEEELRNWQELATECQAQGVDALELNVSCPHMDRKDMGSNLGRNKEIVSTVTRSVKNAVTIPVLVKLTPSTTNITVEAEGAFNGGADAISSSNTFMALPLINPDTLEFEISVDGQVSTGGLGGPAIFRLFHLPRCRS